MDWSIVEQYLPLYQKAFFLTLHIAVWGILGSFLLGLIVSIIRHYRIPVLAQVATAYIELSRNTPLLIQLFFLYFGLPRIGIVLSSEVCATLGLVFLGGSYMAESFRSGLEAISQTQQEIGLAIGLTPLQVFRYGFFRKQQRWHSPPLVPMSFSLSRKPLFSQQWLWPTSCTSPRI